MSDFTESIKTQGILHESKRVNVLLTSGLWVS